ncbi:MAG TPA: hypothetical protein VGD80_30880 [Kofleriaceae bacterium]
MVVRILIAAICLTATAQASPLDDLASPSQEKRDAAAAALRASYKPLPGARWIQKFGAIKPGATKKSVIDQLTPVQAHPLEVPVRPGDTVTEYRLDDGWALFCIFKPVVDTVIRCGVRESVRHVAVDPPSGYTGPWVEYFASGQRAREASYRNGVVVTSTLYRPNGNKAVAQTYGAGGRVQSTVHYDKDGKVTHAPGRP